MRDDDLAIPRKMDIGFEVEGAEIGRGLKLNHRVFRTGSRSAAMTEDSRQRRAEKVAVDRRSHVTSAWRI